MTAVAIHNTDGQRIGTTSIKHAVGMIVREVAHPYKWVEDEFFGPYPLMTAVILVAAKYVYPKWFDRPAPFSPAALRLRDDHTCGYCGQFGNEIEHIVPKSRGGRLTWDNTVVACRSCNAKKANKTPEEAGMVLRFKKPWTPTIRDLRSWKNHD